jgi:hypothetical protein
MVEELVVAYFEVVSWNSPEGTEDKYKNTGQGSQWLGWNKSGIFHMQVNQYIYFEFILWLVAES